MLLIAVPLRALLLLAEPILATLFYYGDVMTSRDITMATFSLRAILGADAFMLVVAPGFFPPDMRTPVRIGVIAMVSNMFLNLLFVLPLHHYWQIGHVGLALATSVSAFLNAGLLFIALRKKATGLPGSHWLGFVFKLAFGVAAMLVALVLVADYYNALDAPLAAAQLVAAQRQYRGYLCCWFCSLYCGSLVGGMRLNDLRGPAKATSREHQ